jgi:ATP-dependent Clp protease ATP-binding subunit ClpX
VRARRASDIEIFTEVQPEDLRKFGLIPEFIGRLPVIATVTPLDRSALMQILTEPKNALVKQYQRMFELDGFELEFEKSALEAIADLAVARETGARGLRAIMEEILGPVMFEIPGSEVQGVVKITKAVVTEGAVPQTVPFKSNRKTA